VHLSILFPAIVNGVLTGALYALIALGLTLVYGVLHIINFAHGTLLTSALFAAFFMHKMLGVDPYIAVLILAPAFFGFGYGLQRLVIGPASHGNDGNILLVTLGLAVIIENAMLFAFRADTRTIDVPYGFAVVPFAGMFVSVPRLVGFGGAVAVALLTGRAGIAQFTDACVRDPEVLALRRKVELLRDPAFATIAAAVDIATADGKVHRMSQTAARGSDVNPMSDRDLEQKLREAAAGWDSRHDTAPLIEAIWTLDRSTDVSGLALLAVPGMS